ncbi:MAG: 30S ribosomal protein S12 methylthiotransferase RimO [Synergistaceae bacterium]|jgi:ribosomal protein S12 methylthiotransferase|nr:30S ribosomal protein S12 methylthiotransferase RimO [Synergistaceae bacterium]
MDHRKPAKVFCLTLGCSKNKVDSERIISALSLNGFEPVSEAEDADAAIVNTCGFIRSAVEENIGAILDLLELKEKGSLKIVGVVGCLVARYGGELKRSIPEVDFWAGCEDIEPILASLTREEPGVHRKAGDGRALSPSDFPHVRYLKISEGCSRACSFCTIPAIRGAMRSRPIRGLVEEASELVRGGASEICLVAQDLTAYGEDMGRKGALIELLDALESSLPKDVWLRLLYLQPSGVDRALLERVAGGRQVLPYLDIPIQHSVSRILELMNRGSGEGMPGIFETARSIRHDFALRTTCMVGFPGETRRDFDSLLKFIEYVQFDRVGAFAFSPEEGTAAAGLTPQVAGRTRNSRLGRLMSLQEGISQARNSLFVGRELDVIIDETRPDGSAGSRSFREAPEVDGMVELASAPPGTKPGDKLRAVIDEALEHDLEASFVGAAGSA